MGGIRGIFFLFFRILLFVTSDEIDFHTLLAASDEMDVLFVTIYEPLPVKKNPPLLIEI